MNAHKPFKSLGLWPIPPVSAWPICLGLLWTCLGGDFLIKAHAEEAPPLQLLAVASASSDGVFLPNLFAAAEPLPAIRLADAPAFGKYLTFTRAQICELLAANAPAVGTNLAGADTVKIIRRTRTFGESDLLPLLTTALQQNYIKTRGQLEIRLGQPWNAIVLPDEPLTLEVTDLPSAGVTPGFIARFTLRAGRETLGQWSANLKANVWREVWVATSPLKRGEAVNPDALLRERRDVLVLREALADFPNGYADLEMAEPVPPGQPLFARMIKARTVVHRGQRVDAVVQDGAMSVRTKVEVLEDGAPGQIVRARNTTTRRDLSGTVLNEKTILISL